MTDIATHSQLSALIRHRRSIKPVDMDSLRMVERALLTQVLEDATWAPTHGLTEPWKFVVHQGAARQRLAETMQRIYRETTPTNEFREDKMKKMGENPLLASVVIACVMERRGGAKIPEIEEIEAVACALQNLMLSATAAGLLLVNATATGNEVLCRVAADWCGRSLRRLDLPRLAACRIEMAAECAAAGRIQNKVVR